MENLAEIVGDTEVFLREFRDKKPLLRRGAIADPASLLTLKDVDDLLVSEAIRPPYFRMAKKGAQVRDGIFTKLIRVQLSHMDDVVEPSQVIEAFRSGATITWNSMNHFNPTLRRLTTTISQALGCRSDVVSFLTPAGRVQGFAPHLDSTEVFVIQLHGTKAWKVWDTISPRPAAGYALDPETLGEPAMEFEMNPGDILYLPWGTPHVAASVDQMSFHLSVTTKPRSIGELMGDLVNDLTKDDPSFAEQPALTPSNQERVEASLTKAIDLLRTKLQTMDVATAASISIAEARHQVGSGHLNFFEDLAESESPLGMRDLVEPIDSQAKITYREETDGNVVAQVGTRIYRMTDTVMPALDLLNTESDIRVGDVSESIGEEAASSLLKTLVQIGHVKVVRQ